MFRNLCHGCSWERRERLVEPDPNCPDCAAMPQPEPMVPLRLVEAIAVALDKCWREDNATDDTYLHGLDEVDAVIRAAIEAR